MESESLNFQKDKIVLFFNGLYHDFEEVHKIIKSILKEEGFIETIAIREDKQKRGLARN